MITVFLGAQEGEAAAREMLAGTAEVVHPEPTRRSRRGLAHGHALARRVDESADHRCDGRGVARR